MITQKALGDGSVLETRAPTADWLARPLWAASALQLPGTSFTKAEGIDREDPQRAFVPLILPFGVEAREQESIENPWV